MAGFVDRRRRRSRDPIIALHYQLSTVRREAGLDALVLVDDSGCLVAGAGAWPVCEELAAYAPFLARRVPGARAEVTTRTAALANDTHVRPVPLDGMEALLCARSAGGRDLSAPMQRAAAGCRRILDGEG
jgi:hypothetical protein